MAIWKNIGRYFIFEDADNQFPGWDKHKICHLFDDPLETETGKYPILIDRNTTERRDSIPNPVEGMVIYHIEPNSFEFFSKEKWHPWKDQVNTSLHYHLVIRK